MGFRLGLAGTVPTQDKALRKRNLSGGGPSVERFNYGLGADRGRVAGC